MRIFQIVFLIALVQSGYTQNVIHRDFNKDGLIGRISSPDTVNKYPVIFKLGGSEGGLGSLYYPDKFVPHGYVVFELAYFKLPGLPDELSEIPLEYIYKGYRELKRLPNVDSTRIGFFGGSKGAELILLFNSIYKTNAKAIVVLSPSDVVWQHVRKSLNNPKSSWTLKGKPLPYVYFHFTESSMKKGTELSQWVEMYSDSRKNLKNNPKAIIEVERMTSPLLLLSGKDDRTWPSSMMSDNIISRLKAHKYSFEYRHVSYDSASHVLYNAPIYTGGSKAGNNFADSDSMMQIINFLDKHLKKM